MLNWEQIKEELGIVTRKQIERLKWLIKHGHLITSYSGKEHFTKRDYLKSWKINKGHLIKTKQYE